MLSDMTTLATLHEAGGRIAPREDLPGPVYKIRIMGWQPGAEYTEGSSAMYPVAALKASIPDAFPKSTRMRANHDGLCEDGGDITRIVAKTIDTPWEEADGMYTNIQASPNFAEVLERYAEAIGVSISAGGEMETEQDEDGEPAFVKHENGKHILKRLMTREESPYNAIDFVEAPGADGRIVALVSEAKKAVVNMNVREQATFASTFLEKTTAVPPLETKTEGYDMTPEELKAALAESRESTLSAVREMFAEATPAAVETEDVSLSTLAEAIVKAGLTEGSRAAVYEAVRSGVAVETAIESAASREKAIRDEITESLKAEPRGYVAEAGTTGSASLEAEFEKIGFSF